MIFNPTLFDGCFLIQSDVYEDGRGNFARNFCADEFSQHALNSSWVQQNSAFNRVSGTFRGLHFQDSRSPEIKLIQCIKGEIVDFLFDIRSDSVTFGKVIEFQLCEEKNESLYVPAGIAHGYQTLRDDTVVSYLHSHPQSPAHAQGFMWNDPKIALELPLPISQISTNDQSWPAFNDFVWRQE
jgi:dTDP-4-dehydrorhamnose 3,5-epimerase